MKISHDTNGNKTLVIESSDLTPTYSPTKVRGFSVQTLGNLPVTHSQGVTFETKQELLAFIDQHGTKAQRTALSCDTEFTIDDLNNGYYYGSRRPVFRSLITKDIDELVTLLGGRKKEKLRSALMYNHQAIPHWAATRLSYTPSTKRWGYCAGQDYTAELNQIRKALIN